MADVRVLALIDDLRRLPAETAWVEFKENNTDPNVIGKLISALSNSARIEDRDFGYVVWGVRDGDHTVAGTRFDPDSSKRQGQSLAFWLSRRLRPDVVFSFKTIPHPEGRLVLLEVPAATTAPVELDRTAYIRIGGATPRLVDHPERQKALWDNLRPYAWETGIARQFIDAGEVLDLLDHASCFELTRTPRPESRESVLAGLHRERLIARDVGGKWNVLNLGAILFARDLGEFAPRLARKAVRFVVYDGNGRAATVTHRKDFSLGYASGFRGLNDHVNALIPSPENIDAAIRKENPLLPRIAIRELLANALIHQDMTMTGTGPTVELFRNRMEIVNPGAPLVEPARFIDSPPRSRNEALASLMRRMGLCEEQGTGIDKTIEAVEQAQLPPPEFRAEAGATRATLFGPRRFADMTTEERLRACYQHAVLYYLSGKRMKNSTLRNRFGVASRNAAQISQVVRRALDEQLIRVADPARPRSGYIPFWA